MERLSILVRGTFTFVILALTAWGFIVWWTTMGDLPKTDETGRVVVDSHQQAKDILLVLFPILTTVTGYWFGAHGKERAEERAERMTQKLEHIASVAPGLVAEARASQAAPTN